MEINGITEIDIPRKIDLYKIINEGRKKQQERTFKRVLAKREFHEKYGISMESRKRKMERTSKRVSAQRGFQEQYLGRYI
ncbi:hypothetical protein HN832_01680 [archaeon]|jgi:hypothetical protein|nr:hypothetical protein [archaeon]MBT4373066.1 hypothetical protein [archaeon]MBT4531411.1 hypothetical protein [archaeon]MBT7001411.1 hypothetical protein [archaeon]MBT7282103.1 hypothetical protein [archaeon]